MSEAELRLWEAMTRDLEPLVKGKDRLPPIRDTAPLHGPPRRTPQPSPARAPSPSPSPSHADAERSGPRPVPSASARPPAPKVPPLAELDRRRVRQLARGRIAIDARLDLHGLCQREAHAALLGFLRRCQADGLRHVKVITGKGRTGEDEGAESFIDVRERGVLRRAVPHWLAEPAFRALIVGYAPAGPAHGGEGALYIQLRRAPTRT